MKTNVGSIFVLVLSLTGVLVSAPPKEANRAKSPSIYQASNPTGKWRYWTTGSYWTTGYGQYLAAANKSYFWFRRGNAAWRYNVSTRKIDLTLTALSHPALWRHGVRRIALSNDGQTVISSYYSVHLHNGKQWRRLPPAYSDKQLELMSFVLFDQKNRLWAFSPRVAMLWDAETNRWNEKYRMDESKKFMRLVALPGEHWYAQIKSNRKTHSYILDSSFQVTKTLPLAQGAPCPMAKSVALIHWNNGANHVCRVNETGVKHTTIYQIAGVDYGSDSLFTGEFITKPDQQKPSKIKWHDAQGRTLGTTPIPPVDTADQRKKIARSTFFRDGNGDLWWQNWRHDGTRWISIAPPSTLLPSWASSRSLLSGRLTWQSKTQTWMDTAGGFPHPLFAYDRATNTGWAITSVPNESQPKRLLQRWKFAKGKPPTELDVYDMGDEYLVPLFMAGKDLWLRDGYRYRGSTRHRFDVGTIPMVGGRRKKGARIQMVKHPSGAVWMCDVTRAWKRYDPKQDKFAYGHPYDAFSFEVAGRTLAIVGPQDSRWSYDNTVGAIYEKRNGTWNLLQLPFAPDDASHWVFARPEGKALRKNRLLVGTSRGVFEIDLKSNRWARLTRQPYFQAWFDEQGRRWMATTNVFQQSILMYDGDPFQTPAAANELAKASIPAKPKDYFNKHPWRIPAYQDARWGRPLFDRMHTPISTAPDQWTISVDMKLTVVHATMKLLGAFYAADHSGKSIYVLPDLSLLTVGYRKKPTTVESITHTPARRGDVDPVPRSFKSFDLSPYARKPKAKTKPKKTGRPK
jgi:hypothetical protein